MRSRRTLNLMLHSASYFQPQNHKGILIPISQSIPKGLSLDLQTADPLRDWLSPSWDLLNWYKAREDCAKRLKLSFPNHSIQGIYRTRYKAQVRPSLQQFYPRLQTLANDRQDYTLLCWEPEREFCHRLIVMLWVFQWFPSGCGQAN